MTSAGSRPLGLGRTSKSSAARRTTLAGTHAVMAANAFAGAWYALAGAPDVPTEWLAGTPFDTYKVPGLILGIAVATSQAAAALAVARRSPRARPTSVGASTVLLGWIGVQLAMIGYVSPLQPIVLASAFVSLGLAGRID